MTYIFHSLKFLLKKCNASFPPRVHNVKHFLNIDLKVVASQQKSDWILKHVVSSAHFIPTVPSPNKSFYFLYLI